MTHTWDFTSTDFQWPFAPLVDFFLRFIVHKDSIVQDKPTGLPACSRESISYMRSPSLAGMKEVSTRLSLDKESADLEAMATTYNAETSRRYTVVKAKVMGPGEKIYTCPIICPFPKDSLHGELHFFRLECCWCGVKLARVYTFL